MFFVKNLRTLLSPYASPLIMSWKFELLMAINNSPYTDKGPFIYYVIHFGGLGRPPPPYVIL